MSLLNQTSYSIDALSLLALPNKKEEVKSEESDSIFLLYIRGAIEKNHTIILSS